MDVWYSPGSWLVVASPQVTALADLAPESPILAEWSRAALAGGGPDELLAVVMQHGLGAVPSFAFLALHADGVRIVVRGEARAWLTDGRELGAEGAPTWRDGIVGLDALPIRLGGPRAASSAARLPLAGGVVLAASVDVYRSTAVAPSPAAATASNAVLIARPPATPAPSTAATTSVDLPAATDVPAAAPPVPLAAAAPPPDDDVVEGAADYAHLFAPTAAPPPVPRPAAQPEPVPEETLFPRPDIDPARPAEQAPDLTAASAAVPADDGVISAFPWAGGVPSATDRTDPPTVEPPAEPMPEEPEWGAPDDGGDHTVARSALPTSAPVGPTVLAAYCPAGHLSPVHAQTCRVCDRPVVPDQQPMTIPRPVLGVLRLPGGQTIPLDRGVLLGRSPVPSDAAPGEQPHAVSLASPDKDISRNHVEIRLDGWHVLAVDLGSVNGTVVVLPGRPPQRLRPEEPVILERGTEVVLADEVSVRFEVPA